MNKIINFWWTVFRFIIEFILGAIVIIIMGILGAVVVIVVYKSLDIIF